MNRDAESVAPRCSIRSEQGITRRVFSAVATLLLAAVLISPARAQTGAFTVNGTSASQTGQTYAGTAADQSAVYVRNSGHLTLTNCTMTKTGDASNVNNASQYGINAGILAASAGTVTIVGGSVTTNASGANGIFATGSGSAISMTGGAIHASGGNAHGVDVTYGGSITLTNVDVTSTGASSSVLATDFGGGTVTVSGGTHTAASSTTNSRSAGIYSTGVISVTGATVSSLGDCGGVIDGANSILLTNTALSGALHGIKIWKTAPASGNAAVTLDGGSLSSGTGDAFYVTAETGNAAAATLTVKGGATISAGTGNILNVLGASTATLTLDGVTLGGNLCAASTATATATLQNNASLTGVAYQVGLTMDVGSVWNVTGNSILTSLADAAGISGSSITNIVGNGHHVHYNPALPANSYLGGQTYALVGGGTLTPDTVPVQATSWGSIKALYR